jgi:hypothetical protein
MLVTRKEKCLKDGTYNSYRTKLENLTQQKGVLWYYMKTKIASVSQEEFVVNNK